MNRHIYNLATVIAAVTVAAGCNQSEIFDGAHDGSVIAFDVSVAGTGSSLLTKAFELTAEGYEGSIPLNLTVEDGIGVGAVMTKGTLYNTSGSSEALDNYSGILSEFEVGAFDQTSSKFIIPVNTRVTYSNGEWSTQTNYYWENYAAMRFLGTANVPADTTIAEVRHVELNGDFHLEISYNTVPEDARQQQDILIGYYEGDGRGSSIKDGGVAQMLFEHPLTSVEFRLGKFNGISGIRSISIENVYKSGTVKTAATDDIDLEWGYTSGPETETVVLSPAEGQTTLEVDDETGLIGEPFIIIPQDFSDLNPVVKVVVATETMGDITYTAEFDTDHKWEAGKTNIYTLGHIDYEFYFTEGTDDASKVLQTRAWSTEGADLSNPEDGVIPVTSCTVEATPEDVDWQIKSYKIGTADAVTVNGTSFTDKNGITVTKDGSNLKVTKVSKRQLVFKGSHDYWANQNPARTDNLDWSPEDWSTSIAAESAPLDLSKFNFRTETAQGMTTANTYIVRHAGTYKIPLVYGNGVVNGHINELSYYPNANNDVTGGDVRTTGDSGNYRLVKFQNHLGNEITSAFIENNSGCVPTGCAVVWQDEAVVVKELSIIGDTEESYGTGNVRYLQFTVDKNTVCQNNAVICIYKDLDSDNQFDDGEAIWSWCIWTTNDPALLSNAIPVTNYSGVRYDFFPINSLGWVEAGCYPAKEQMVVTLEQFRSGKTIEVNVDQPLIEKIGQGNYYEFGRKDPLCRKNAPQAGSFASTQKYASLGDAIGRPGTHYLAHGNDDWCDTRYYNLWTGKSSSTSAGSADTMIKTVYDPSPAGYMVPSPDAFTGFTTTGANGSGLSTINYDETKGYANGYYFYTCKSTSVTTSTPTIFFPFSGWRGCSEENGGPKHHGYQGSWWTSIPDKNGMGGLLVPGHNMQIYHDGEPDVTSVTNGVNPANSSSTAHGFSVRPVRDVALEGGLGPYKGDAL